MTFPTDPHRAALEAASMAAWPGLEAHAFDGWLCRFGAGHTKRANSVSLLRNGGVDPAARLAACEALFADWGLPPHVRLSDEVDAATLAALEAGGYLDPFDVTVTLWRDLATAPDFEGPVTVESGPPSADWLDDKDRISGDTAADAAARRRILAVIAEPTAYAASPGMDGRIASVAYVTVSRQIASLNMVATDPAQRGQRLAERTCNALMAWAWSVGARQACLQVVEANTPARRLYARLGFSDPLYRYAYRAKRPTPIDTPAV